MNSEVQHPSGYSEFRKRIINILREPYKKEEYDELRLAVEARKTEHSKESHGEFNLDCYPDLHEKLIKFEKDRKKNLMERGFFFWLENKTMEGAFKPWKDPECAAVEQENCVLPPPPLPQHRGRKKRPTPFKLGNNPENLSSPSPWKKKRTPSEPVKDSESVAVKQEDCSPPIVEEVKTE